MSISIHKNKKAQLEFFGIALVVILLILAMLFVLQFSIKKTASPKAGFVHAVFATNTLAALMETDTYCQPVGVLLRACIFPVDYTCIDAQDDCATQDPCDYLICFIEEILNKTLPQHLSYNLTISTTATGTRLPINITRRGCPLEKKSHRYIRDIDGIPVYIRLDVC